MSSLGARLVALRTTRKLSQRNLAIKTNISNATISRIENGEVMPDANTLQTLASFFNVTTDYLLTGNADNTNPIIDDSFQFALYDKTKGLSDKQRFL